MIFACGKISRISPICRKLFGILSIKKGLAVLRWILRLRQVLLAQGEALRGAHLCEHVGIA